MSETQKGLPELYAEIAALTNEHCKHTCTRMGWCCDYDYCQFAMEDAAKAGVKLEPTGNPKLPMLGADGKCIVPPHLRRMCSLHSCDISSVGFFKGDRPRTVKYMNLRQQIEKIELVEWTKGEADE